EVKAKAAATFKAQIEKLQQERDEFQRMVKGNQFSLLIIRLQVWTQQIHEMKKKEKEYIKILYGSMISCIIGETKLSVDGEKGVQVRHGDTEFTSGGRL
ncbi:hypothetical protein GIB67_042177, partial [Kingdonia uniflora]